MVVNGNAKQVTDELVQTLDQIVQSGDLFVSRSLEEAQDIARAIVERGYPTVLTGGGDGTFVQMVTSIVRLADATGRRAPRFGLLRLGTGNALAWFLGAQNQRVGGVVADLARLRKEGGSRPLRLVEVERLLSPFAGVGADAIALRHYQQTKDLFRRTPVLRRFAAGGVTYGASIACRSMPEFAFRTALKVRVVNEGAHAQPLGPHGQPRGARIPPGGVLFEGPVRMVTFGTIPYWGFGAKALPYAEEREDRFHLRVVDFGSLQAALHLRALWRGVYYGKGIHDFLVERVSIHCDRPTPLQVGGDALEPRSVVHAALAAHPIQVVDYFAPPPV